VNKPDGGARSKVSSMIRAMLFDLDETLVKTERLKAISYAKAVAELCPDPPAEEEVLEAFTEVVGLSRREVAQFLVDRFGLHAAAEGRMRDFGVNTQWQAFVQIRLGLYEDMLADSQLLRRNQWPHNVALLNAARQEGCKTGLATMSYCAQVHRVLEVLDLADAFDFVASRDDVEHGKPDPEIYLLLSRQLEVDPAQCLVIEDSPSGVQAALQAGMDVVAVSTPLTRRGLHESGLLPPDRIVYDPRTLMGVISRLKEEHGM